MRVLDETTKYQVSHGDHAMFRHHEALTINIILNFAEIQRDDFASTLLSLELKYIIDFILRVVKSKLG